MGCAQSKIENDETLNRCKERKQHMERAVTARNKFAAAHSSHAMSLKDTGAALSDYALPSAAGDTSPPPPYEFPPPPPPLPDSFFTVLPRPATKHSDPIIEEESFKTDPRKNRQQQHHQVNLQQIFSDLDDCFLKASESAHEVSTMLEAPRLHYHSKKIHSERVMRAITWNRSFRGLPNYNYNDDDDDDGADDDFDSEEEESTHATVLDKMLAWEKKLYDEVMAGELTINEYQKKVFSLNKLKKKRGSGSNTLSLEKMKAALSHMNTRYKVDMLCMDSTVSEINRLRDHHLYPKLVSLLDGMATMWDTIRKQLEKKSKIAQALRLLDISQSPEETSDHHHERTRQLGIVLQEWHTHFTELMDNQKEYIKALNRWLKLSLVPIDTNCRKEKVVSSPGRRPQNPPIQTLLHAWQDCLEKLPDEATINNFADTINNIWKHQKEELEFRNKCADSRKQLIRKTRDFEYWRANKYIHKWTPPDEMDPESVRDEEVIAEKRMVVEAAKHKLEEEEEAHQILCIQVREKSLRSLKSHLPELFRALSEYSLACFEMYSYLRSIANARNRN